MLLLRKVTRSNVYFSSCNPDYGEPPSCTPESGCDPDVPCNPSDQCTPTNDNPCAPEEGNCNPDSE